MLAPDNRLKGLGGVDSPDAVKGNSALSRTTMLSVCCKIAASRRCNTRLGTRRDTLRSVIRVGSVA
jgi:hypothetical protein